MRKAIRWCVGLAHDWAGRLAAVFRRPASGLDGRVVAQDDLHATSKARVRTMGQLEQAGGCEELADGIAPFVSEYVQNGAYRPRLPRDGKIIHDALWGTIWLYPWEVALLDLPLFQRLRQVSQTSLVSYVFPGCRHSRFEHTLGVIHQAQRLADAVNHLRRPAEAPYDPNLTRDLRLAALFHDCGHGCFSHISENLYRDLPDMAAATDPGAAYDGCTAHEVMGAMILKSAPVREFIRELSDRYEVVFNVDRAADWIVGKADGDNLYQTQVVNGPFDADKLDYLFRDAHYSGLPVSLDLDRLWASAAVGTHPDGRRKILTLHQASVVPLEQILFSKINLFAVVYQHPKVRAAECMFEAAIGVITDDPALSLCGRRLDRATDFLWVTDAGFFAEADRHPKDHPLHKLIHDILYRRHFVRAITISRDTLARDEANVDAGSAAFHQLRQLNQRSQWARTSRRALATRIWRQAKKPCADHEVWLDLPSNPSTGAADHTYVRTPGGEMRALTNYFPMNYWGDAYIVSAVLKLD